MVNEPDPEPEQADTSEPEPGWKRWVFGVGVVLFSLGLGLAVVPKEPSTAIRIQGAVMAAIGLAGVWTGRMSLAARRKSSAWDRSWR